MTFPQADRLCERIIDFMVAQGGPYPEMDRAYLQWCLLGALASRQFVLKMDKQGVRYFANWWWLDKASFDSFKTDQPEERIRPPSIDCGRYFYVVEVCSRGEPGDAREMIRRLRKEAEPTMLGAYWHQAHRNHRLVTWKEQQ